MAPVQGGLQGARQAGEHGALWIDSLRERFGPDAVSVPSLRAVRRHAWHEGAVPIDASIEGHHDDREGSGGVNGIHGPHGIHDLEGISGMDGMGHVDPTQAPVHALASEPSCVWPRPERITVTLPGADAPWPIPPSRFRWRGAAWRIIGCQGPQRLVGAWWHVDDAGTRDHWRVHATRSAADPSGDHAWLALVRHDDGSWWVQGAWT